MWAGLVTLTLAVGASAEKLVQVAVPANQCAGACKDAVTAVRFGDSKPDLDYYNNLLQSKYFLSSMALCLDTYCSKAKEEEAWHIMLDSALEYGDPKPTDLPTLEYARSLINHSSILEMDANNPPAPIINSTILTTQQNFDDSERTERVWTQQMIYHHAYGWALYLLLGVAVMVGMGNRLIVLTSRGLHGGDPEAMSIGSSGSGSLTSRVQTWYRHYISIPATFGYRHRQPWGWVSIPARLQTIMIFIFCALNLIWTFTNFETFTGNMYWSDTRMQWVRYFADRTGIMAFYNLPLLWVLAGRNDVLMWLTGWSFDSLNMFHRWIARVATFHAIAHSAAYTWLEREELADSFKEKYWACGVFATVTMSLLLPLSMLPIRKKAYELFLIIHVALALPTLVLLFYHVEIFKGQYDGWLWACSGVWCFDRLLRLVRIVSCSWRTFGGKRNTVASLTGGDDGLIRLSVNSSVPFQPYPGSYYFLYARSFMPWENHPFTLASWEKQGSNTVLNFLIAPQGGATRRLQRRIEKVNSGPTCQMSIILEGPYGNRHHLESYNQVLLIAGGSGITAILPYVFALRDSGVRRISVVWIAKYHRYIEDVLKHELSPANTAHIELDVHITQEEVTPTTSNNGEKVPSTSELSAPSEQVSDSVSPALEKDDVHRCMRIVAHRPEMKDLLQAGIKNLVGSERLAVLACGPAAMVDDLRHAVANSYGSGEGQVSASSLEYFEESFGW